MTYAVEMLGITKRFPGVLANNNIDFRLQAGEIHALLGENGAGKTTLMNILYGLYRPDAGRVLINGAEIQLNSPAEAIAHCIGMVHQHFMLIPVFTVAENIILGNETVRFRFFLDRKSAIKRISALSKEYGLDVDPLAYVKDLPVGTQQRVEIVKALYRHADILILDEPTAVLTPQEADEMFIVMRALAKQGKSIIFITHKLKEVFAVADRITVLRDGQVVGTTTPKEATPASLATMMVGRAVEFLVDRGVSNPAGDVLAVQDLAVMSDRRAQAVDGVSFSVRAGEVLGVAGVEGNGQTELAEALTGLRPAHGGRVTVDGKDMTNATPRRMIEAGVAHIPEDRQKYGLVLSYPVADNLSLCTYYQPPFAKDHVLNDKAILDNARQLIAEYDIRTPSALSPAGHLSGGNQQKAVVARELSRPIRLLVAAQPTRGLDVGSTEFIHKKIVEERSNGVAVLLVSAELDEIMSLSDRIAVMYKGKIIDILPAAEATREKLGLLMAGVK
jgi:general nucleoside transport system ATP-binding protein